MCVRVCPWPGFAAARGRCVVPPACVWVWVCVSVWHRGGRAQGPPRRGRRLLGATRRRVRAQAPSAAGEAREARGCAAVLPPSERAVHPLGAPGSRTRGSGGRAGTPGARLPPGGPRTPPAGRRGALRVPCAARPAPEARPAAPRGRGGGRTLGPPPAAALVGSAVWRVERAGTRGWRWERAVGVDCSAPEPRCLWLPCLAHSDLRARGAAQCQGERHGAAGRGGRRAELGPCPGGWGGAVGLPAPWAL